MTFKQFTVMGPTSSLLVTFIQSDLPNPPLVNPLSALLTYTHMLIRLFSNPTKLSRDQWGRIREVWLYLQGTTWSDFLSNVCFCVTWVMGRRILTGMVLLLLHLNFKSHNQYWLGQGCCVYHTEYHWFAPFSTPQYQPLQAGLGRSARKSYTIDIMGKKADYGTRSP